MRGLIKARVAVVVAMCLASGGGATARAADAAAAPLTGFIYQQTPLQPFTQSRQYLVSGTKIPGGCHYSYPELRVPAGSMRWAARDIAVNPESCTKLVEEGVPPAVDASTAQPGSVSVTSQLSPMASQTASPGPATAPLSLVSHSAYHHVWWEDILGIRMTQDTTNISWATNGSCVVSGLASGWWAWTTGTGWRLDSKNGGTLLLCPFFMGQTQSTFSNSTFCWPLPTVYTYYYYVSIGGFANGSVRASRSSDSVNECAPFWMHYEVVQLT